MQENTEINEVEKRMTLFKKYLDHSGLSHNPHQYEGVKWCLMNELNAESPCGVKGGFIADEMGLGKTITIIGLFVANVKMRNLIVVPPILIGQWESQIKKTTGHSPTLYYGDEKKMLTPEKLKTSIIVLTTYNTLIQPNCPLYEVKWERVVFDEAHHLRNRNSRHERAKQLQSKIRWLVSGTPVQNRKQDFYNLCSLLGLPASFYTDRENLKTIARNFILKRTKKMVGIELEDVKVNETIVEWKNENEYKLAEALHSAIGFTPYKSDYTFGQNMMALMVRAKQACILPRLIKDKLDFGKDNGIMNEACDYSSKMDAVVDIITQNKDNGNGKIVFCHFREEMREIESRLRNKKFDSVAIIDGSISKSRCTDILNSKYDVLIIQIKTGSEGLNLQENYSEIYFVSPNWNPAIEEQAIARCHRIGQMKPVNIYRFEMGTFYSSNRENANCDDDENKDATNNMSMDNYITIRQEQKKEIAELYMNNQDDTDN